MTVVRTLGRPTRRVYSTDPCTRAAEHDALRERQLERLVELTDGSVWHQAEYHPGELVFGPPKSEARVRVVTIPSVILDDVKIHLKGYAKERKTTPLFADSTGLPIRRSNFQEHWTPAVAAVEKAGIPGLHFHDLRHIGNIFAVELGALSMTSWTKWAAPQRAPP